MKKEEVLETFNFKEVYPNEFVRDIWTVRFDKNTFELFADPEIDRRYYFGYINDLESRLKLI